MDIIIYIIIFLIGSTMGVMFGLIIWLKQLSDDTTKYDIEIARLQGELEALKEKEDAENYNS